jgi:16S rRNA C1402 N4-methylase RsmH
MIKITELAHKLILEKKDISVAVDMTVGKGNDTHFLAKIAKKVYGFDIQPVAIDIALKLIKDELFNNVELIKDNHENIKNHVFEKVDVAIYNLGYLPQGDKLIKTETSSTINSLKSLLEILNSEGLVVIVLYSHNTEEITAVEDYTKNLSSDYDVLQYKILNRTNSPYIISIKKR